MANVSTVATPTALRITGGEAATIPARFTASHARLFITGAKAILGPGTLTTLAFNDRTLNVANSHQPIGFVRDGMVYITQSEQVRQQEHVRALREVIQSLVAQVNDNTVLLNRISDAQSLALAANDNATAVDSKASLENSFTDNPTNPLTGSNTGVITIAAHSRVYPTASGEVEVSVNAGSISGLTAAATYWVYYLDSARAGGAVSYVATQNAVSQTGNTHVVGKITLPAAGEPDTSGTAPAAPGAIDPSLADFYESLNPRY